YSNGIQAEQTGQVYAKDVIINVDGAGSYTFGVEAGKGGQILVEGDSTINVAGTSSAAGARAYSGKESTIVLDGTTVNADTDAIGLMAGDTDGDGPGTAGTINLRNGEVIAKNSP